MKGLASVFAILCFVAGLLCMGWAVMVADDYTATSAMQMTQIHGEVANRLLLAMALFLAAIAAVFVVPDEV